MDDSSSGPRNRRERRAAARDNKKTKPKHLDKFPEIELTKPDFDAPRPEGHKTLYEIAAERQAQLEKEGFYDNEPNSNEEGDHAFWAAADDKPIGAFGEAIVWSVSLAMLHFTLDVLTFHQYRQNIEWAEIWQRTFTMAPALFVVVYMLHTDTAMRWVRLRQVFFFGASVSAGCFLVKSGNRDGYYAVMKKAPPIGTLWIWSCIEMDLWWALGHVFVVGAYMWWNGFGNF